MYVFVQLFMLAVLSYIAYVVTIKKSANSSLYVKKLVNQWTYYLQMRSPYLTIGTPC